MSKAPARSSVTARITNADGVALSNKTVVFSNARGAFSLQKDGEGKFAFSIVSHEDYDIYVVESGILSASPENRSEIGKITISRGEQVDLGTIVLTGRSPKAVALEDISGPLSVVQVTSAAEAQKTSERTARRDSIAALFVAADGLLVTKTQLSVEFQRTRNKLASLPPKQQQVSKQQDG